MVLNIDEIRNLCKEMDIVPTKNKGQNFLINEGVLSDMVEAANLSEGDTVLEVGPGFGILTEDLAKKAGRVVAVELDDKLFNYLKSTFKGLNNLELNKGDILELLGNKEFIDRLTNDIPPSCLGGAPSRCDLPLATRQQGRGLYKVVANLPYQITSRFLRLIFGLKNKPSEIVVMVQKEVGERICAIPGKMSVLAVMVQYYGNPEIVRIVDKSFYWPEPEVHSAIIKISDIGKDESRGVAEKQFFQVVKVGFSNRRKLLRKNLSNVFDGERIGNVMKDLGLSEKVRAQELEVGEWVKITEYLNS